MSTVDHNHPNNKGFSPSQPVVVISKLLNPLIAHFSMAFRTNSTLHIMDITHHLSHALQVCSIAALFSIAFGFPILILKIHPKPRLCKCSLKISKIAEFF